MNVLMVFVGGGLGSLARYGLSVFALNNFKTNFPIATLLSNVLSCLVLAITVGFFFQKQDNPTLRMLLLTGFCGGFSTFSTFSFETVELIRSGNTAIAIANVAISIAVCFVMIFLLTKSGSV